MADIGLKRIVNRPYVETLALLTEALKSEDFGILTEVDLKDTFKKKLEVEFRRYKILGACNPRLALRALSADLDLGVMLPCNVVVYEQTPETTVVVAVDPMQTVAATRGPALSALVDEVRTKLGRALDKL